MIASSFGLVLLRIYSVSFVLSCVSIMHDHYIEMDNRVIHKEGK
jgi:hypothetical protein